MADEEKTGLDNTATPVDSPAEQAEEAAEQAVDNIEDRLRDFETRLTNKGRSEASLKKERDALKADLTRAIEAFEQARKANTEWQKWYLENHATPQEKDRARLVQEAERAKSVVSETSEIWKQIAKEEDPKVKKALVRLADAAEKSGEQVTKGQIRALKASFETEDTDEDEKPPKVSGPRSTGTVTETWDQKYAKAKASKNVVEMMNLQAEKAQAEKNANKR